MNDLVTVEQLSGYLRRGLDVFDAYTAQLMLDGAAEAVIEYCGWHIAPLLPETVTLDGSGTRLQPLPTLNLASLDTLTENGSIVDPAYVDWSTNGLLEKRSGALWTTRRRGVVAEIGHGYATTPAWLVTLICAMAARAYMTPSGIQQESAGGESISYTFSQRQSPTGMVYLHDADKRMLDRIRVPMAA